MCPEIAKIASLTFHVQVRLGNQAVLRLLALSQEFSGRNPPPNAFGIRT
jgi:hypothetical protein